MNLKEPHPKAAVQPISFRLLLLIVTALAFVAPLYSSPSGTAASTRARVKACGQVAADYPDHEDASGIELIAVRAMSCRAARREAKKCITHTQIPGWSAHYDRQLLGHLRSGRRTIVFKGIAGGAPRCMPDPYGGSSVSVPESRSADGHRCHGIHAGTPIGDGEYSRGVIRTVSGISCRHALALVKRSYKRILRLEVESAERTGTFRIRRFRCNWEANVAVTLKRCHLGSRRFRFL